MLEELDPEVEWHPAILGPGGRGSDGVPGTRGHAPVGPRSDEVFDEIDVQYSEIRDRGDQVVWVGQIRMRGRGSGA